MESTLEVTPFQKECSGSVVIPGSKSITNRALLLAALSKCKTRLSGVLKSQDVELMVEALKALGIETIENWDLREITVRGCGGNIPEKNKSIYVGNAGTVARFLTAWLAIQDQACYSLDGSLEMRKRPIGQLLSFFQQGGVDVTYQKEPGHFPFTLNTSEFNADKWSVDATKSSQILSALMMVAPLCSSSQRIDFPNGTVSLPFLLITKRMIEEFSGDSNFSCQLESDQLTITAQYSRTEEFNYKIEPDATAASYFLTLPLVVGGSCNVLGIWENMLQGDAKYANVLSMLGGLITKGSEGLISSNQEQLKGGNFNFNDISDTFLTLAAISPLLKNPLKITGISHTRLQETDRVNAMATELKKLGQKVIETDDSLEIIPDLNKFMESARNGIKIETYEDHRVAMSFAVLGSYDLFGYGRPWLTIENPECCGKTFPDFFEKLEALRTHSMLK